MFVSFILLVIRDKNSVTSMVPFPSASTSLVISCNLTCSFSITGKLLLSSSGEVSSSHASLADVLGQRERRDLSQISLLKNNPELDLDQRQPGDCF